MLKKYLWVQYVHRLCSQQVDVGGRGGSIGMVGPATYDWTLERVHRMAHRIVGLISFSR
jgi:hypothetical protein